MHRHIWYKGQVDWFLFQKNKDFSNKNIGNNKNAFPFAIPLVDFFTLSPFDVDVQDVYAHANRQTKIGEIRGKQYVISWNHLVYLVFSGYVSTSYYRECIIFILREPTFFFSCMAWSVYDKTLQNIFHQNDVPATAQFYIASCNKIKGSFKFWVPRCGFPIPATAFRSF